MTAVTKSKQDKLFLNLLANTTYFVYDDANLGK